MSRFDREATLDDVREDARELLRGAIDVHVHAAPDPYAQRRMAADALVARAVEAGMGGLVLKSHEYNTQPLAWLLDRQNESIRVYGGIALDHGVGRAQHGGRQRRDADRHDDGVDAHLRRAGLARCPPRRPPQPRPRHHGARRDGRPPSRGDGDPRPDPRARRRARHRPPLEPGGRRAWCASRDAAGSAPWSRTARSTSTSKCSRRWPASGPTWSRWRRPPATRTARSSGSCSSPRSARSGLST